MSDIKNILLDANANICLSGGAIGADLQWGMCAGSAGHKVIHWSFEGHNSGAPDVELVRLTEEQLAEAIPSVKRAAKALGKHPPRTPGIYQLIYRNYYQVAWAESVYAVTTIEDGVVQGGTAWAVQMYLDRLQDEPDMIPKCYVFDQYEEKWFKWVDGVWEETRMVDIPSGIWAGIGSRDLNPAGKNAIRSLLQWAKPGTLDF